MKKRMALVLSMVLLFMLAAGAFSSVGAAARVKLELFQNKREAVGTFDELIARFEKEHPDIDVVQNFVPEAETVLKVRLVKNDIPDIMAIGGNFTYGELARAGVLADFSKDPALAGVQKPYVTMLNKLAQKETVNGIPFSANANTILYNRKKFEKLGLTVPKTWDEFVAMAEKIKKAGEVPFYLTFKDAWTAMVPFNTLASNLQGDDFIDKRKKGQTTFKERYPDVAAKMLTLLKYGHKDNFGVGYDQGNAAFANGESVMLIQGIWAISSIKKANPEIEIGVFSLPPTNDPKKNRLVSGVDTALTMSKKTRYPKEAKAFIDFLLKKENAQYYINQQKLFSAVKGVYQEDPELVNLKEYFESGRITSFADHYYPSGMQVSNLVQEFLLKGDVNAFLRNLDAEWDKTSSR
ncbi:MAG: extracellular solute-binding protein [Firmicutes bacterium]|nr:extracellular solute-binding protein [Bacillota bacterium]